MQYSHHNSIIYRYIGVIQKEVRKEFGQVMKIMFLGDSITAGQYIPITDRFTTNLEKAFSSSKHTFCFEAISGQTSRQALILFPEKLYLHKPDMLLIQLGINDSNVWKSEGGKYPRVSASAFRENLIEIIERSRIADVREIRLMTNHTLNKDIEIDGVRHPLELNNLKYNGIIREVGNKMGVGIYDIADYWRSFSASETGASLLLKDGVHLSSYGHTVYGEFIRKCLLNDLKYCEH